MGDLTGFSSLEKYQLPLNLQPFPTAFQADDEGSIPFTRSNVFDDLRHADPAILTSCMAGGLAGDGFNG